MKALTAQDENYLKAVWAAEEWSRPATNGTIASTLGLAPSSVTEAIGKLAAAGLVEHAPYGAVTLTDAGRAIAIRVVRKHRLIETFLVERLGYAWHEVHEEAEILEHAVSVTFIDRLAALLGDPEADPHGDPIPRSDGSVPHLGGMPIGAVAPGSRVRIVRVSDAVPGLLERLDELGLGLGSEVIAGDLPATYGTSILVVPG